MSCERIRNLALTVPMLLFSMVCVADVSGSFESQINDLAEKTLQAQILLDNHFVGRANLLNAAELITEVLEEDDEYAPAYVQMSRVVLMGGYIVSLEFQGGTLEKARMALELAIELDPDYPESYVLMGHVDVLTKRYDSAKANLSKAVELGSTNPWINNNFGSLEHQLRHYSKADEYYERTVQLGKGATAQQRRAYVSALTQQMNIAYQQSDGERLTKLALLTTSAVAAEDAWTWGNSGGLLCRAGFLDLGLEHSRKAVSIMSYGVARYNVAYCLYGKWAELTSSGNSSAETQLVFDEAYHLYPNILKVAVDFRKTDIAHLESVLVQEFGRLQGATGAR